MKRKILTIFTALILLTSCGFKVIDKTSSLKYAIKNIESEGDKKVNFFIKNNLIKKFSSGYTDDYVNIKILSNKKRAIKEKNIKNQITKYNISISTRFEIVFANKNIKKIINLNESGYYDVNNNKSVTTNNQNNLEKHLARKISKQITDKIIFIINDL
jgi:outer membrane lipopolysaccharide assembly protein LptE/RlpB